MASETSESSGGRGFSRLSETRGGEADSSASNDDEIGTDPPPGTLDAKLQTAEGCAAGPVERAVRDRKTTLRYCYESELEASPRRTASLDIQWTIDESGTVQSAEITNSTSGEREVHTCVRRAVERIRFEAPEGAEKCRVEYRLQFDRSSGGP